MAGVDYARMAATTRRLVTDNGTPAILRKAVPGAYDPVSDTSGDGVAEYPFQTVLTRLNQGTDDQDIELVRESFVQGRATKAFLAAQSIPSGVFPAIGDRVAVTASNEVWVIRGINVVYPANVALLYILVMERA